MGCPGGEEAEPEVGSEGGVGSAGGEQEPRGVAAAGEDEGFGAEVVHRGNEGAGSNGGLTRATREAALLGEANRRELGPAFGDGLGAAVAGDRFDGGAEGPLLRTALAKLLKVALGLPG